ncbi:polymorphic toxin-type HINT domain-containing protein [Aeoliella mucimassa]|uniref:Hint domain-containing protein n=1 Tax=Aeoliella mucimassa TaxID=2527972 RepID=A0A518ATS7_9BACT|nr:polymorphic toxin-type HINT domain-containing protein [Aeoliella mucimassa]QDU58133.1 hypothetical protein Pan181_43600 [Aeoliella mucimassa]
MRLNWCFVLTCLLVGAAGTVRADDASVKTGIAERMTREAKSAGATGDLALRDDLLQQAARLAPDFGPAHWNQGEILVDGQWQSIHEVQSAANSSSVTKEYAALREAAADTPSDHLRLARWCRKNDLNDEARFHWLKLLSIDRENREALHGLNLVAFEGDLVEADQLEALRNESREFRKRSDQWRARIAGWHRALKLGGVKAEIALAELGAEVDESAIPEFERLMAGRRGITPAEADRDKELSKAFLLALGQLPSYQACESLVRISVLAEEQELRTLAGEQLKARPEHEYIPLLVSGLAAELETHFEVSISPTGRVQYDHEVFAEGPNGGERAEVSRTGGAVVTYGGDPTSGEAQAVLNRGRRASAGKYQDYQREAAQRVEMVAAINEQRLQINNRIIAVLAQTTGEDLGDSPQAWWDYWYEKNGYESRNGLPEQTYRISTSEMINVYVEPPSSGSPPSSSGPPPPLRHECFAAGTEVWTKTGMQAIETLAAGDLVLTMNERSGELCFRPVLTTTVRAPSPLTHVDAGGYQLQSTPGHPFWVEGKGWQMASELQPGDYIFSAQGSPVEVSSTSPSSEEQEAYNLIVEGNNNYFVGPQGLLSHDNSPRRPELARLGSE